MNIFESSYIVKLINKLDLSNVDALENLVNQSVLAKVAKPFLGFLHPLINKYSGSSLLIKGIDYLILINLILLLIAITFSPTVILGLLIGTCFGLTILKWIIVPGEGHNLTLFDIPIGVYICIALISVAFSSYFMPSAKGFAKLITYFASYIVCTNIFKGHSWKIYFILAAIAITGGLEACYGIYQKFAGVEALATWQDPETIRAEDLMNRVYGSLQPYNPNLLAGYLLPILPCALGIGTICMLKKAWHWVIGFYGLGFASLICLVLTGSRGAYIGLAGMVLVLYFVVGHIIWHDFASSKYIKYLKWGWILSAIMAVILVILALIAMPALSDRIMTIFTLRGNSSNSFRMNVYLASFNIFKDNWLIGIGPGNTTFRLIYGLYMLTGFDALGTYSVPLEVAVEMGIVGLAAFCWLILVVFSNGIKMFNSTASMEVKILITTILTAFIGIGGQGLFDTIWYRPQVQIIFWLLVAILSCIVSGKVSFIENEKIGKH